MTGLDSTRMTSMCLMSRRCSRVSEKSDRLVQMLTSPTTSPGRCHSLSRPLASRWMYVYMSTCRSMEDSSRSLRQAAIVFSYCWQARHSKPIALKRLKTTMDTDIHSLTHKLCSDAISRFRSSWSAIYLSRWLAGQLFPMLNLAE